MARRDRPGKKAAALLAVLETHQGRVVSYRRLCRLLGLKSTSYAELHLLRQHMAVVKKMLAARKARRVIAVVTNVGYALCPMASPYKGAHYPLKARWPAPEARSPAEPRRRAFSGSIMIAAGRNFELLRGAFAGHTIDQSMLSGDAARPPSLERVPERLGLA